MGGIDNDFLQSKRKIMKRMNIGEERFFRWLEMGAPVACEVVNGKVTYSASYCQLQEWRVRSFPWRKVWDCANT